MAQEVMALVAKLDDVSSIPGTHKPGASQGTMLCGRNTPAPFSSCGKRGSERQGSTRHPSWFVCSCTCISHGSLQHPLLRSSSCCTGDVGLWSWCVNLQLHPWD